MREPSSILTGFSVEVILSLLKIIITHLKSEYMYMLICQNHHWLSGLDDGTMYLYPFLAYLVFLTSSVTASLSRIISSYSEWN